jgi:hypothetical protein
VEEDFEKLVRGAFSENRRVASGGALINPATARGLYSRPSSNSTARISQVAGTYGAVSESLREMLAQALPSQRG